MLQEERYKKILNLLKQNDSVKVTELVHVLNVSIDTVRRDLENMETKKLLKRVHGGAILPENRGDQNVFSYRESKNKEKKMELAELACEYVSEGQAIALNAGTTTMEIAKKLAESFERLTVISNGLRIIEHFSHKPGFTIIVPGGILDQEEYALYGKKCEEDIGNYNIDQAFISINAISLSKGLTDFRIHEIDIIRAMMENARQTIIAADSSKFEKVSYLNVCPLEGIDMIITDSSVNEETIAAYSKAEVKIVHR
ncbi:DeoR/GlpR family DNA-binding transcription regulator [Alkalihalobacillus oceani]|uniref:DeoR/GlpR family DNA-binding transcription regulator n=1 Tax=Halalkalibacter oceani TaxID=1653776 RepID=A0A9X2IQ70_9BACI|nr:DeoR/GlpR family DNA-binding transcription regulator [Halalkalibacter oceani]MCM3715581.1 DeoR/GlpR family DNA-binding transcription regulator [Halalkalibacter oceani]